MDFVLNNNLHHLKLRMNFSVKFRTQVYEHFRSLTILKKKEKSWMILILILRISYKLNTTLKFYLLKFLFIREFKTINCKRLRSCLIQNLYA